VADRLLTWDTLAIIEDEVASRRESDQYPHLSDEELFRQVCEDHDLFHSHWQDVCDALTEMMEKQNPASSSAPPSVAAWQPQSSWPITIPAERARQAPKMWPLIASSSKAASCLASRCSITSSWGTAGLPVCASAGWAFEEEILYEWSNE